MAQGKARKGRDGTSGDGLLCFSSLAFWLACLAFPSPLNLNSSSSEIRFNSKARLRSMSMDGFDRTCNRGYIVTLGE
ncbi:hypothetical protein DL95DRAFT_120522 [Leptodontidium sp. 2 PMI_412]|nr:hypothetical protein DL95DRAFT_120522 [Leptodontidium sp. 2 PMI_412]